MQISLDWIRDFVEMPSDLSAKEFGVKVTMGVAEVEEVLEAGTWMKSVQTAKVLSLRKHPDADKIRLVTLELGNGLPPKEVVCGAANVREGLTVLFAKSGATLPCGITLEPKNIRGFLSDGMICSKTELGLEEHSAGIWELPEGTAIGMSYEEFSQEVSDTVLDIDNKSITHRPDLWGHLGMSREIAAIFSKELKNPYDEKWEKKLEKHFTNSDSPIRPKVDADSAGLVYYGLSIDGVQVGESPKWMQRRLRNVGLRPINSIVDISNYVMLELGIPNHVFDRDMIKDNTIEIKRLGKNEKFTTLDEIPRDLIESDTVICDSEKPLVIGGIMGGLNCGVNTQTNKVFVEVANWKAAEVRRTSTRLGLRTDSSARYEKSLDSLLCRRTMLRILELILELNPNAKVVGKIEGDGVDLNAKPALVIETSHQSIVKQLGIGISAERIEQILTSLAFQVEKSSDKFVVTVPSFRATKDIECEADIVEEVGRVIGYDNITPVSPQGDIKPIRLSAAKTMHRKIQDFLMAKGNCLEIFSYPMIGEKLLRKTLWPTMNEKLVLINALSQEQDRMRPSLIPSVLEKISLNTKNYDRFSLFELGRVYSEGKKTFSEEANHLFIGLYDEKENPFLSLVNLTEKLLNYLNVPFEFAELDEKRANPVLPPKWPGMHPYEFLNIKIMGRFLGAVNSLHPVVSRALKVKGNFCFAVIDLASFEERPLKEKTKYTPLQKFPSSVFDCTVVTDKNMAAEKVLEALRALKIKELQDKKIVDVFELDQKSKSVTLRVTFANPEKTLSSEFIENANNEVVRVLNTAGFPLKS